MKVLFVGSGNINAGISTVVLNQGETLRKKGVELDYFPIFGKGLKGYFSNISRLRRYIRNNSYNLVHAHYALSAIIAALATKLPVVASIMGSEVWSPIWLRLLIKFFCKRKWKLTIVKTLEIKNKIGLDGIVVIPNGVNTEVIKIIDPDIARNTVNFNNKKHILFLADPSRQEKNYSLANDAFRQLADTDTELNVVNGINHNMVSQFICASDVVLLTSLREGSPNVIKEALFCNVPVVSTDVGDVRDLISGVEGCFICSFEPLDVADKLRKAIAFSRPTNGRAKIVEMGLTSEAVALRLITEYEKIIYK